MRALFKRLNNDRQLRYVVQRSWLEALNVQPRRKDVDLLVNDYYYFKRITGARTVDTATMRENNNGYNIQNTILLMCATLVMGTLIGDGSKSCYNGAFFRALCTDPIRKTHTSAFSTT